MKTSKNNITGDSLISKPTSDDYRSKYDAIFGKKKVEDNQILIEQIQPWEQPGLKYAGITRPHENKQKLEIVEHFEDYEITPDIPLSVENGKECPLCKIKLENVTGYSCSREKCPCFVQYTC